MKGYYVLNLLALLATIGIACAQSQPTDTPETTPTLGASQTSKATPRPLAAAVNPDTVVPTKVPLGLTSAPTPAPALTSAAGPAFGTMVVEEDYLGYDIITHRGGYYGIRRKITEPEHSRINGPRTLLVGESVADLKQQIGLPALAEEGYQGYNIIQLEDRFYAIPQEEGSFDYSKFQAGGYLNSAAGYSLDEVKKEMEGLPPLISTLVPTLVTEGSMGYNIIQLGNRYYAIPQEEGSFDYDKFRTGGYLNSAGGYSLNEIKKEMEGLPPLISALVPTLVTEGYLSYNIVQLELSFYGVPQEEGAFDHSKYQAGGYLRAVDGDTLKEVKDQIRNLVSTGT